MSEPIKLVAFCGSLRKASFNRLALNAFVEKHQLKPAIDKVFEFENAPAAFDYMDSGALFGKVVIRL